MTPPVSIIIPAFNCGSVIAETLESVRSQTFKDFEAIVVDDGSTDDTASVVRGFCELDSRFCLVEQSNGGVSSARNKALSLARGEWIAFLDGDDVWLPAKLERQMELGQQDPKANYLFANFYFWDGQHDLQIGLEQNRPLPEGDVSRNLIFNISHVCPASMSTALIRREMFLAAGTFDTQLTASEDWDLLLRMAEHGLWVRGTREPLVRYRRWEGNVTNQKLKIIESNVRVLEKSARMTRRSELKPLYRRSLALAQSQRELVRARGMIDATPKQIPAALWRAWQFYPRRLRWLLRFMLVTWPKCLGGDATAHIVHRKLAQKF
jgi:glycosyltransferase involved in cell wall biosynthesis